MAITSHGKGSLGSFPVLIPRVVVAYPYDIIYWEYNYFLLSFLLKCLEADYSLSDWAWACVSVQLVIAFDQFSHFIKYCPLVFLLMPLFCLSRISQTLQCIAESQLGTPVLYELIEVRGQERDLWGYTGWRSGMVLAWTVSALGCEITHWLFLSTRREKKSSQTTTSLMGSAWFACMAFR